MEGIEVQIAFRARSERDMEQQKKEFQWIRGNLKKAREVNNEKEIQKWEKKLENWLRVHPVTRESYEKAQVKIVAEMIKTSPDKIQRIIDEMKEEGK